MATWQVQEAKTKLSELIERAQSEGPQTITRHGKAKAVVLSAEAYEKMRAKGETEEPNFVDFLLNSGPKFDDFEIERDKSTGRDIDLGDIDVD
jgi:prevent-host-death family protein